AQRANDEGPAPRDPVALSEVRAAARRAVDVRHAEVVADDGHVVARALGALDLPRLDPEGGVLVEGGKLRALQARRRICEVDVRSELVLRVGGMVPAELERRDLGRVHVSSLGRGQDIAKAAGVVGSVWLRARSGRGGGGEREE